MVIFVGFVGWYEIGDVVYNEKFVWFVVEDCFGCCMGIVVGDNYGFWFLFIFGEYLIVVVFFVIVFVYEVVIVV